METLIYLIFAAVVYGIVADQSDRAVDREMRARRQPPSPDLRLVEDLDIRPVRSVQR